jgi:hypothetical protein
MFDNTIDWCRFVLCVAACIILVFCVDEINTLRGRVSELENAAPVYPEINISIPEDWLRR